LAQADDTLESFGNDGSKGPDKPAPRPKSSTGPSSITNVSDLHGCWTSAKGGTTLWSGVPHYFRYCFNKSGRAKSLSVLLDKRGNKVKDCKSGADAKMDGKGFILIDDIPNCPGWDPGVFNCKLRSPGTVNCTYKSAGGQSSFAMYYNADLKP
jgi:hypothetical protein